MAESLKLLAKISYGYQIRDQSQHTVTKYLKDKKIHGAINTEFFRHLGYKNDQMHEVEFVTSENERKEPNTVGFLILQYVKLRMLEL